MGNSNLIRLGIYLKSRLSFEKKKVNLINDAFFKIIAIFGHLFE